MQAMTNASASAIKLAKNIEKAGGSITNVGKKLTTSVTVPIIGAGVAAGKMALDFEDGIAKVSTIADTSVKSIRQIKEETLSLSNAMGAAVTEISEAQYNAISAGAKTEDSLKVVETAVKAAKAGFTDTATAIDGLTTVYNSYQGAVNYSQIADQMMATQNYGKTTFGELASSMGQVTPVANALNVSTQELFSSIAILTKNGINTSSAVTGMKAAYSNILKPTSDAAKEAERLGLEFNAAHLKTVGWAQFLAEINEKTKGNTESMAKLFGSVEALNSMTVLAGAGFGDFNTAMNVMAESVGLTQKSYEKMLTPAERWNISLNKIKNAGIKVGEKLLPVFEKITDIVGRAADSFNGLSDEQVNMVIKIAGIAAAAGPAIFIFGKLVTTVGTGIRVFNTAAHAIKVAGGIMPLLTSPVGLVIGAIVALVAAIILVIKHFDKVKAAAKQFAANFEKEFAAVRRIIDQIKSAFSSVAPHFKSVVEKIKPMIASIKTALEPIIAFIGSVFIMRIKNAISFVSGMVGNLKETLSGLITVLDGIITFVTGVFSGNWKQAWEGCQKIFSGAFGAITGIAKGVINGISSVINNVINSINGMGITIPDWVPVIGGKAFTVNIPTIPMLAKGTRSWEGGFAQVHEKGGEIIDLPRGSRVYPHDESLRMARREGNGNVTISKLADQIIVREDADIDRIADALVRKLMKASGNRGGIY